MGSTKRTKPREAPTPLMVRFETASGDGFFGAAGDFLAMVDGDRPTLRSKSGRLQEIEQLTKWICDHTSRVPSDAYQDSRSRRPYTWFKPTAREHIRKATLLCALLNREGLNIRRLEMPVPARPLWEDDVQIVIRRPRSPKRQAMYFFTSRIKDRVARQKKRRERIGRIKARAAKSGI